MLLHCLSSLSQSDRESHRPIWTGISNRRVFYVYVYTKPLYSSCQPNTILIFGRIAGIILIGSLHACSPVQSLSVLG